MSSQDKNEHCTHLFCFHCGDEFPLPLKLLQKAVKRTRDPSSSLWKWPDDSKPNTFFNRAGLGKWLSLDGIDATFVVTKLGDRWYVETICEVCRKAVKSEQYLPKRLQGCDRRHISTWRFPQEVGAMPHPESKKVMKEFSRLIIDHWHELEAQGVD